MWDSCIKIEKSKIWKILSISLIFQNLVACEERIVRLVYSVNAGGPDHKDVNGIFYKGDSATEGVASDYGMKLSAIGRVQRQDEVLYRTERYSDKTFGYEFKLFGDGQYVIVMKFAEVYFQSAGKKVFDVVLNRQHTIAEELDIYSLVGFGSAHQEVVPFLVSNNGQTLTVNGKTSAIKNNKIRLEFVKGRQDNPKINAFYVIMGSVNDIPRLPEVDNRLSPSSEFEMDEDDDDDEYLDLGSFTENSNLLHNNRLGQGRTPGFRRYKRSGAFTLDPWDQVNVLTMFYPVILTLISGCLTVTITVKLFKGV